ncbi:transposase [Epilithonimonas sp.]|uniref:transposase n=1 Tax=Epilithonimonas sp. TaxID=2894511 RepID=UPI0028A1EF0E|nr:transposase [Epilithonimonas sp.]
MNNYNPQKHHRQSIRLQGYDYSQEGLYFITICCQDRAHLFGRIVDGEMILNDAGSQSQECWQDIPNHFPNVVLHEFVIMPNHIHGIIEFVAGANNYSPNNDSPNNDSPNNDSPNNDLPNNDLPNNDLLDETLSDKTNHLERDDRAKLNGAKDFSPLRNVTWRSPSKTIGSVVRGFKIGVTKWMRNNTNIVNVWQRNYYDHIIRNEQDYERISEYIKNNPILWKEDRFYDNNI